MPLDLEPVAGGNVLLVDGVAHVGQPDGRVAHVSHFTTCPDAATHRRDP